MAVSRSPYIKYLEADALAIHTEPSAMGQSAGTIARPASAAEGRIGRFGRMFRAIQSEGRLE
jgi:hypothetical protein